jgi:hypothetical protein
VFDAMGIVRILNAHAHPDIIVPGKFSRELDKSLRSLRQNLKSVPIGFPHHIENTVYEFKRNIGVKKIAHRIDKDLSRLLPLQRLVNNIGL